MDDIIIMLKAGSTLRVEYCPLSRYHVSLSFDRATDKYDIHYLYDGIEGWGSRADFPTVWEEFRQRVNKMRESC